MSNFYLVGHKLFVKIINPKWTSVDEKKPFVRLFTLTETLLTNDRI